MGAQGDTSSGTVGTSTAPIHNEPDWGAHAPRGVSSALVWLSRNTFLGRGSQRKVIFRAFAARHPGPVDITLWGAPVRLFPHHNVCENKALLRPDRMDPEEHDLVRRFMSGAARVMVDVGANAGLYCLSAAFVAGAGSKIIAIEPNAKLTQRLAFNMAVARRSGLVDRTLELTVFNVAVSDNEGEAVLFGSGDEGGRSLTIDRGGAGMTVPTRPLAAIVDETGVNHIDVLKIDVEGHEDHVLPPYLKARGGRPLPRFIVIEHISRADWKPDCISLCQESGYKVLAITRNNTMLEHSA